MTLKKILNELLSVEQIPKKIDVIFWKNGKIFFDNKNLQDSFGSIVFRVMSSSKTLKYFPMDDYSELKKIKQVQQALKDLIKAKIIDLNWKIVMPDKQNVVKSFGSNRVGDLIKVDTNYSSIIPICFHGTSTTYLPYILKNGILARKDTKTKPNWARGYIEDSVNYIYLTIDYNKALFYAEATVDSDERKGRKSKPVILKIKNLDAKFAIADDDFKTGVGPMLMQLLNTGKKAKENNFTQSIRNTSQFAYLKSIPINKIYKVFKRH